MKSDLVDRADPTKVKRLTTDDGVLRYPRGISLIVGRISHIIFETYFPNFLLFLLFLMCFKRVFTLTGIYYLL